jgi:hypothetical protein
MSASASAQENSTADTLFQNARIAMRRNDYATACPLLAESLRLEAAAGTRLNLAMCEESIGRLVSAAARYRTTLDELPTDDARVPLARARLLDVEARLPRLLLRVEGPAAFNARVFVDGTRIAPDALGTEMPLDPGDHRVTVEVPGGQTRTTSLHVDERARIERTMFMDDAWTSSGVQRTVSSSRATLGWSLGATGAAAIVTSFVLGALVLTERGTVDAHCDASGCDAEGLSAASHGRLLSLLATSTFAGGLAATGIGAYLVASAPTSKASPVATSGWLVVGGRL